MSRTASVERLSNSRIVPEFYWWRWEDMRAFLGAALEAGPGSIIRAYPGLGKDGEPDVHFTIQKATKGGEVQALDGGDEGYNVSHPCPPFCPGEEVA
jgi:hypothetical protein